MLTIADEGGRGGQPNADHLADVICEHCEGFFLGLTSIFLNFQGIVQDILRLFHLDGSTHIAALV